MMNDGEPLPEELMKILWETPFTRQPDFCDTGHQYHSRSTGLLHYTIIFLIQFRLKSPDVFHPAQYSLLQVIVPTIQQTQHNRRIWVPIIEQSGST